MRRIDAVIWDFGGVFTTSPFEAFARYERENGLPDRFLRTVIATNHLGNAWARFEQAQSTLEAFDRDFAEESAAQGFRVPGRDLLPLLLGDLRPAMVEALRRVKARTRTGCITNNLPTNQIGSNPERRTVYATEVLALFDHILESAKIGIRKPDPRIYAMMVEALGADPSHCIYLDDLGVNLKPAREMGMTTIKVTDPDAALAELEAATGWILR